MTERTVGSARRVLDFWLDDLGPAGWYAGTPEIDARVHDLFLDDWEEARAGAHGLWLTDPAGALAFLILTDQMPRNMFRGAAQAFDTDPLALAAAKAAIARDWDLAVPAPQRQFFYLPLEHAEDSADQDRAVALFESRMPEPELLLHARAHRAIIGRFGRFPGRNAALSRRSTATEAAWLAQGGYGAVVAAMRAGQEPAFPH